MIGEGVEFMHSRRLYHRDLKFTNIIILEDFRAQITDFGSAKFVEDDVNVS